MRYALAAVVTVVIAVPLGQGVLRMLEQAVASMP